MIENDTVDEFECILWCENVPLGGATVAPSWGRGSRTENSRDGEERDAR